MKTTAFDKLLHMYTHLLSQLEAESSIFCENLLASGEVDFASFDISRQNMIEKIQNIDSDIHNYLAESCNVLSPEDRVRFDAFKLIKKESIERILQTDEAILSETGKLLCEVRNVLQRLSNGRSALKAYGSL
jgi:hypothetical protein